MKAKISSGLALIALVSLIAPLTLAQDYDDVQNGIKAYGTYRGGDIDSVSMTNGNLVLSIPLISYTERGKAHLSFSLLFANRRTATTKTICPVGGCTTFINVVTYPPKIALDQSFGLTQTTVGAWPTDYALTTPDGASHSLAPVNSTTYESVDGTGFQVISPTSSFIVTDSDGVRYFPSTNSVSQEDPNGNQILNVSGGGWKDTAARVIPPIPTVGTTGVGTCPSGPLPVSSYAQWAVPGPNGGNSIFLFCWAKVSVITEYIKPADGDEQTITSNKSYLQSIVLPNGTAWTLQYSTDLNGDLVGVTFPTGGTISYVWGDSGSCNHAIIPPRIVTSRTVNANDGAGNHTWTYQYSFATSYNGNSTTTAIDPLGNNTVYTLTPLSFCSYYETQADYYKGAVAPTNLIKTVATVYGSSASPFSPGVMSVIPNQITTTWAANGHTSQVVQTHDSGFSFSNKGNNWVAIYGKILTKKEYDYGTTPGTPGPLLRQTNTSFAWQSPNPSYSTYLSNNMLNLVYSTQVTDGTSQKALTTYGHDESSPTGSGLGASQNLDTNPWTGNLRGNVTSVNRWRNLPTAKTISSKTTYYDTGMPSVANDPLQHSTTYMYASNLQGLYPTQVTNAANEISYYDFYPNPGLIKTATDTNGQVTTYTYDTDKRPSTVTRPTGGGTTSYCYSDLGGANCAQGGAPYEVVISDSITGTVNKTQTVIVDGFGRLAHTQLNSDQSGTDYVDFTYDGAGNKNSASNPYRSASDSTYGVVTSVFDALHRVTQVTQADNSVLKTAYCGNITLVTDEAGHWRRSVVDALGRLTEVDEPNSLTASVNSNGCPGTNDPVWVTTYGYNQLGDLTSVTQAGSHSRSFSYDSLSRLLTATNPESGTLQYTYDDAGNVSTKITPSQNQSSSGVTTTLNYYYDSVNRLTSKTYTNQACPNSCQIATYTYGGPSCVGQASCYNVGRRTGMTDAAGSESWAYDAMGRVEAQSRTTNNVTKTTSYTYNLDGSLASMTYPSGRVVTYTPDSAGRPSQLKDNTTSVYYATGSCSGGISGNGVCYAPQGAIAQIQTGPAVFSTHIYNNRLQPCWMYSTTGTALATNHLCTDTATTGNLLDLKYNFGSGTNNGNVIAVTNDISTDRSQSFTYDQLNRISSAKTSATFSTNPAHCWGQIFGFDSGGNWGNLLTISGASSSYTGCTQGSLAVAVNSNNQITGENYDAAGNLWVIPGTGGTTYLYNAENQMTSASSTNYVYDGDGNRVQKTGSKIYWYGGGEVLDETDSTGSTSNSSFSEYYYFGEGRVAQRSSTNDVLYYMTDHLGSSRVIAKVLSGQSTATLCYDADFEPYGGEHAYSNTCVQNYKFSGKERDSESNLDNFGARYYASTTGRFMSPDWALRPTAIPYAKFGDPQTLNLYTYVENAPMNRVDADGHQDGKTVEPTDASGRRAPDGGCKEGTGDCVDPTPAQNTAQLQPPQNQPKPGEEHKGEPTSLQPTGSTPAANGAKTFTYQVVDPTGRPVRDVSVQEHVKVVASENVEIVPNPNPVPYRAGVVSDRIGPLAPPTQNSFLKTEQTFTATKGGNSYEMTTKVNQYVRVNNGNVTVQTVVIVP